MDKIYNELLEIKNLLKGSNQKIDSVSNSNVANNVDTQIQNQNNYSLNTFNKPLEYKEKIPTRFIFLTLKEKYLAYSLMIIPILLFAFWIYTNDIFYGIAFICSMLVYFICLIYFSIKKWKANLIIEDDKLVLEQANGVKKEDIYFKDIRSFLKQKSIFGYQFFIYEKTKIEPKFGFTFFSIHKAIAIEELLKSKINKAINEKQKVDLQIAKERSLENNETISLSQIRKLSDEQI